MNNSSSYFNKTGNNLNSNNNKDINMNSHRSPNKVSINN